MPDFILYNSLTRKEQSIKLIESGHLRFYSCGPTVYSYAHIGNFRTFLTADLVVRTAEALGWQVTYVTNITDVGHLTDDDHADAIGEDKMAKALRSKEGELFANVWDLARFYTDAFVEEWQQLNLRKPFVRPRATEHMREQIEAIQSLIKTGHAYETPDAVYFSVPSFKAYGQLSGNTRADALEEGVRDVVKDTNKRDPRDFALWKKDDKHLMQWFSPWGWGFPGWHLECSVMAMKYLGETFDIHGGGEDLAFPHHECEIAQSEALTGKPFANYWVHTRFLQVEGQKMSKSLGNFYRVKDLVAPDTEGGKGFDPLALRLALLSGHYGKPFNFTIQNLKDAAKIVRRYQDAWSLVEEILHSDKPNGTDFLGKRLNENYDAILLAMTQNLNTPEALAKAHAGQKMVQGALSGMGREAAKQASNWFQKVNALLGFIRRDPTSNETDDTTDADMEAAQALAQLIDAARSQKDFARADAIRADLLEKGFEVRTTKEGSKVTKKLS
ncbi:MAG: cysteine--tRNA ligase [Bacteroidetes Order II. Incertae sedis bacterium]|nr:cysteine--tRNA ligase [Bacteroidetes Order II. bacterium]